MVIHRRALDAAEIAEEHGGEVRVALGQRFRHEAPEIEPADAADDEHQQQTGDLGEGVDRGVYAAGGMLALAHLGRVVHDLAADGVERILRSRREDHQRLLRSVGKTALGHEAQGDLVSFIGAAPLDKTVEEGSLVDHLAYRRKDAVEHRGLVVGMLGVFLFDIRQQLGHVDLVLQADLAVGPVRHEIAHNALQSGHLADPAAVASVAPSSLSVGHFSTLRFF